MSFLQFNLVPLSIRGMISTVPVCLLVSSPDVSLFRVLFRTSGPPPSFTLDWFPGNTGSSEWVYRSYVGPTGERRKDTE